LIWQVGCLAASFQGSALERTDFEALPLPDSREAEPSRHGVSGQSPETRMPDGVADRGVKTAQLQDFDQVVGAESQLICPLQLP